MSRLRAVCSLLLLFASGPLLAASASHVAEAKRFVELTRVDKLAVPAYMQVRQMFAQRFAQAGGSEAQKAVLERYQAQADTALDKVVGEGKLDEALVALYTDAFSEAELKELLAFYQTPVGRKVLEQMPQLMAHAAQLTQERLQQAEIEGLLQNIQILERMLRDDAEQVELTAIRHGLAIEARKVAAREAEFGNVPKSELARAGTAILQAETRSLEARAQMLGRWGEFVGLTAGEPLLPKNSSRHASETN